MLLSPLADKAVKLLARQMEQDYDYAMKHRTELLQARIDDTPEEHLQWLLGDPIFNDFKSTYFDQTSRPTAENVLGQDTVDLWVTKRAGCRK